MRVRFRVRMRVRVKVRVRVRVRVSRGRVGLSLGYLREGGRRDGWRLGAY